MCTLVFGAPDPGRGCSSVRPRARRRRPSQGRARRAHPGTWRRRGGGHVAGAGGRGLAAAWIMHLTEVQEFVARRHGPRRRSLAARRRVAGRAARGCSPSPSPRCGACATCEAFGWPALTESEAGLEVVGDMHGWPQLAAWPGRPDWPASAALIARVLPGPAWIVQGLELRDRGREPVPGTAGGADDLAGGRRWMASSTDVAGVKAPARERIPAAAISCAEPVSETAARQSAPLVRVVCGCPPDALREHDGVSSNLAEPGRSLGRRGDRPAFARRRFREGGGHRRSPSPPPCPARSSCASIITPERR